MAVPELNHLRQCAHPIVFETGNVYAPFSVAGTGYIVGFRDFLFVLTARHVVRNWPKEGLAIILSPEGERLSLKQRWQILLEEEDDDSSDLIIFRADLEGVSVPTRRSNHLLHLTHSDVSNWYDNRHESLFFLFGYPTFANEADYDNSRVTRNQYLLHGKYLGESVSYGCFELSVENPLSIESFDGLSGSPVFCLHSVNNKPTQPTFCGMAIRGTALSKRVHFLGSEIIKLALEEACAA